MKQSTDLPSHNAGARARLLEAATALFAKRGYAGTSVREIVEAAGVTKPVLYYYFNNKEGLFRAILDWASEQEEIMLGQALEAPGTVLERLNFLCAQLSEGVRDDPDLFKMIHNLLLGPRHGTPDYDVEQFLSRIIGAIKEIYRKGLKRKQVRQADPEDIAFLVLSLIHFRLHMEDVNTVGNDPDQTQRLLHLVYQGLSPAQIS